MKIYTNKTCPYCKAVKEQLTENKIKFKEFDTKESNDEYNQVVLATGLPTVPTIVYKGDYLMPGRDFRSADHLVEIIQNYTKSLNTETRQAFERVKTLNYNINMAFSRTDQLLRKIENQLKTLENDKQQKQNG